jgi:exo-beta-1,3-glucanase (GH17 family)
MDLLAYCFQISTIFQLCWNIKTTAGRLFPLAMGIAITAACTSGIASVETQPSPDLLPTGPLARQGLAYGPYRDGQSPDARRFPRMAEMRDDIMQLRGVTRKLRTYSSVGEFQLLTKEASQLGFSVMTGAWLGPVQTDSSDNEAEIGAVIELANEGYVNQIIVGNESLLRHDLQSDDLIKYILRVKNAVPSSVKVTTAEPWSVWLEHPELIDAVDFVLVHIYPFWEGVPVEDAVSYFYEKYAELAEKAGKKAVIVGETGWPSAGTPEQAGLPPHVIPGKDQQRTYLIELARLAADRSITFYWFGAYDEEWKWEEGISSSNKVRHAKSENRDFSGRYPGSSWGLMTSNGYLKPHLADLFPALIENGSRKTRVIYDDRGLAVMYDMGVNSSKGEKNWVQTTGGVMRLEYSAGQDWGAVFVTVGTPVEPPRPWKDFSSFGTLSVELRGEHGGESVEIGIKDADDPDDGTETKFRIEDIPEDWQIYNIPLSTFTTAELERLYVVAEFVLSGARARTIYIRNIRYLP